MSGSSMQTKKRPTYIYIREGHHNILGTVGFQLLFSREPQYTIPVNILAYRENLLMPYPAISYCYLTSFFVNIFWYKGREKNLSILREYFAPADIFHLVFSICLVSFPNVRFAIWILWRRPFQLITHQTQSSFILLSCQKNNRWSSSSYSHGHSCVYVLFLSLRPNLMKQKCLLVAERLYNWTLSNIPSYV